MTQLAVKREGRSGQGVKGTIEGQPGLWQDKRLQLLNPPLEGVGHHPRHRVVIHGVVVVDEDMPRCHDRPPLRTDT